MDNKLDNKWKVFGGLDIALGLWLLFSPWVFNMDHVSSLNSWITGAAIAIFASIQLSEMPGSRAFAVLNVLLGAWVFSSPWIFRYTAEAGAYVNSLWVGLIVFLFSIYSARELAHAATSMKPHVHS